MIIFPLFDFKLRKTLLIFLYKFNKSQVNVLWRINFTNSRQKKNVVVTNSEKIAWCRVNLRGYGHRLHWAECWAGWEQFHSFWSFQNSAICRTSAYNLKNFCKFARKSFKKFWRKSKETLLKIYKLGIDTKFVKKLCKCFVRFVERGDFWEVGKNSKETFV